MTQRNLILIFGVLLLLVLVLVSRREGRPAPETPALRVVWVLNSGHLNGYIHNLSGVPLRAMTVEAAVAEPVIRDGFLMGTRQRIVAGSIDPEKVLYPGQNTRVVFAALYREEIRELRLGAVRMDTGETVTGLPYVEAVEPLGGR